MADRLYRRKIEVSIEGRKFKDHEIQFRAVHTLSSDPNEATIRLINLSPDDRSAIEGTNRGSLVELYAGYETSTVSSIYSGPARRVYTTREGNDLVTTIEASSGFNIRRADVRLDKNYKKGTSLATVINDLVTATGASRGNISALQNEPIFKAKLNAPLYVSGPAWQSLVNLVESRGWKIQIIGNRIDVQSIAPPTSTQIVADIGYSSGLIGEPSVEIRDRKTVLSIQTLMLPDILPGVIIKLSTPALSGTYQVLTTEHSGSLYGSDPMGIAIEARPI